MLGFQFEQSTHDLGEGIGLAESKVDFGGAYLDGVGKLQSICATSPVRGLDIVLFITNIITTSLPLAATVSLNCFEVYFLSNLELGEGFLKVDNIECVGLVLNKMLD